MDGIIVWSPGVKLEEIEKQVILKAFRFYRGNKTHTAHALGISIRTLDSRLEEYSKAEKNGVSQNDRERLERENFLKRARGNPTVNEFGASVLNGSAATIQNTAETKNGSVGASSGVRVESVVEARPQSAMSMSQRKEVQEVSPRPVTKSNPGKSR